MVKPLDTPLKVREPVSVVRLLRFRKKGLVTDKGRHRHILPGPKARGRIIAYDGQQNRVSNLLHNGGGLSLVVFVLEARTVVVGHRENVILPLASLPERVALGYVSHAFSRQPLAMPGIWSESEGEQESGEETGGKKEMQLEGRKEREIQIDESKTGGRQGGRSIGGKVTE